jgi:hypothetical protein
LSRMTVLAGWADGDPRKACMASCISRSCALALPSMALPPPGSVWMSVMVSTASWRWSDSRNVRSSSSATTRVPPPTLAPSCPPGTTHRARPGGCTWRSLGGFTRRCLLGFVGSFP